MKPETKIDYAAIFDKYFVQKYDTNVDTSTEAIFEVMKDVATEAIRLAAPLFAGEANVTLSGLRVDKQSIIDAVEKVTKQIV